MNPEPLHPTREELFAYRDGELIAERRVVIEAHVVSCRACRQTIDEMSGLEADLRSRPDGVDERYFERLTDSVLKRIRADDRAPRFERRRPEVPARAEEEPRAVPRIPWAAVLSTASAAAAVLVVVVVLVRQGTVLRTAPRPTLLEKSAPDAGARAKADSVAAGEPMAQAPAPERSGGPSAPRDEKTLEETRQATGSTSIGGISAPANETTARKDKAERDEAKVQGSAPPPAAERAPAAAAPQVGSQGGTMDAGSLALNQAAPGGADLYAELTRRYGLPPVWQEGRVSSESLERAEPTLRNLYRTGGAGADSARVRLYLAEALRLRAGASPDSAAYWEIVHHYQRAIRLAGSDSAAAGVASRRLQEFLQATPAPATP